MSRSAFSRSLTLRRGPSLYATLEVNEDATQEEIKRNYRRLAFKHHPDKNRDDSRATEQFKRINAAYHILSNERKKRLYDEFGDAGIAMGNKIGDDEAEKKCKAFKENPCLMILCGICSFLTCFYCCLCCCFCCCCCGRCNEIIDDLEPYDQEAMEFVIVESNQEAGTTA